MKYILIANTAFCVILGFILVLFPIAIIDFDPKDIPLITVSRSLGFVIVVMSFLSLFMNRLKDNIQMIQAGLFLLTIFHGGMMLTTILGSYQRIMPSPWPFIHFLFMIIFIRFAYKAVKQ